MANIDLSPQALVTVDETLTYLGDQGSIGDDQDLLRMHINAVTALILRVTNRDRLIWIDDDFITEHRAGDGSVSLYLKNAPVRKITAVTLNPMTSSPTVMLGPTEPVLYNDDLWFDPVSGQLTLKTRVFPEGQATVKIVYEAGYYKQDSPTADDPADPEYLGLKVVALDAIAAKWSRWKNQKHGVKSESKGNSSISYSESDFSKNAMKDLRRYRRTFFV